MRSTGTVNAIYRLGEELCALRTGQTISTDALHQAALIIPCYAVTNPGVVAHAKRTVEEVLQDP